MNIVTRMIPGKREHHLDVMRRQPWPEKPLGTEDQQKDQTHDHRRNGERQVDQGNQQSSCRGSRTWRSPTPRRRQRTMLSGSTKRATKSVKPIADRASGSFKAST
jgi:hypothetical protein